MGRFREKLDEPAFRELAERYYDRALRRARERLGCEATAQDAVQETLIRIVRHRRRYRPTKPFAPWFFTVLHNVCIDLHRREQRHQAALNEFAVATQTPAAEATATARLLDLTVGLAPAENELLALRYTDGLSLGQIARQLDCSLDAAKKRLQRLVRRLRP